MKYSTKMTKVIMLSRDKKMLDSTSAVYARALEYATLFDHLDILVLAKKTKLDQNLNASNLSIYNVTGTLKVLTFFRALFLGIKIAKEKKGEDVWITSQDPFESGILAYLISCFAHIKLQVQFHTDCFNILFVKHSFSNYFRALMARFLVPRAHNIRVVSNRIKSSITAMNPKLGDKIDVLPIVVEKGEEGGDLPVSEWNLKNKFPEFKKIILIVARLESEKNIELSLLAFKKMLRFDNSIGLIIAGNGSKAPWLKAFTQNLSINDNVRFIGWVNNVRALFKTADACLVTSLYEGYGLGIVESIMYGCPVVSTDVGIAKEAEATIVPYDPGEIALTTLGVLKENKRVDLKSGFIVSKQEYLEKFKNSFSHK